jgi:hypothetical protein
MGSTYVRFRNQGFEANDSTLEVWLALLADAVGDMPSVPAWLQEAREEWDIQATAQFGFGVMPGLDRFVTDDERRAIVTDLCRRALVRLEAMGDPIPAATLNGIRDWGKDSGYTGDVGAINFLRPARYFIKLLEGRLGPGEVDARFPSGTAAC